MATAGYFDRTTLNAEVANLAAGLTADPETLEDCLIQMADQSDANWSYLANLVVNGTLSPYPAFLYRNAIINGNFDIWQRGSSFAVSTSLIYTADRWVAFGGGGSPSATVSRQNFTTGQTDVPNEPTYYLRFNQTASGTSDNSQIQQRIEDVRTLAGKSVNLSFWAKGNAGHAVAVDIVQFFGSGGSAVSTTSTVNINVNTSWQKFEINFNLPSISGKTIGTNSYIYIRLSLPNHPWTGTIDLAQVQLCASDVALPFQPRSLAEELALCQRYYEKSYVYSKAPGTAGMEDSGDLAFAQSTTGLLPLGRFFKVQKRIQTPTMTLYSYNGTVGRVSVLDNTADIGTSLSMPRTSDRGILNITDTAASFIAGSYYWFGWTADADL